MEQVELQSHIVMDEPMVRRIAWYQFRLWSRGPLGALVLLCVLTGAAGVGFLRDSAGPVVVATTILVVALPFALYFKLRNHCRRTIGGRTLAVGFGETAFVLSGWGSQTTIAYTQVRDVKRRGKLIVVRLRDGRGSVLPVELITDDRLRLLRSGGVSAASPRSTG
ncbi:hypothetical protein LLS1_13020 [Leifsonia sp. LS1]|uniref:hypothetical protein n=1 Tax=Leifsonia sp. LS1 TaxID=2828483 RepID=UPI001CFD84F5|nr:hypothetical protein [Leifsonia sp. LS1]GIT79633.1 hypothetical protein LLS1_13020 [Leifsonia sp. LS1]